MHFIIKDSKNLLFAVLGILTLQACNKEFESIDTTPPATTKPEPTGTVTLNELINTDTSFSFLKAAVAKAGLNELLDNPNQRLTFFAPDNAAFRRSGIPSDIVITALLDSATVRSLVRYH